MSGVKIGGTILIVCGVGFIVAATFFTYRVFSGVQNPPQVFQLQSPEISLPSASTYQLQLPEGLELPEGFSLPTAEKNPVESSKLKLVPDELINGIANMSIYLLLMGFITSSGAKIANIGVKMVKDIKVEIKEEKIKTALKTQTSGLVS